MLRARSKWWRFTSRRGGLRSALDHGWTMDSGLPRLIGTSWGLRRFGEGPFFGTFFAINYQPFTINIFTALPVLGRFCRCGRGVFQPGFHACLDIGIRYFRTMSEVLEIERAVQKLSRSDLTAFRDWFLGFDAEAWDRQFAEDVSAGRLDALADEAIQDLRGGRCKDL